MPSPPSLRELVQQSIRQQFAQMDEGTETFEEADDFEVNDELDDLDWSSRYEMVELTPEGPTVDETDSGSDRPLDPAETELYERLKARVAAYEEEAISTDGIDVQEGELITSSQTSSEGQEQ